jgi:hypothetical protein
MGTDQQRVKWAELRTQWGASSESVAQDLKKIERVSAFPPADASPAAQTGEAAAEGSVGAVCWHSAGHLSEFQMQLHSRSVGV